MPTTDQRRRPSLFKRLGRYRPSGKADPRENKLTEDFAAVLEHVPELIPALLDEWQVDLKIGPCNAPRLRTQQFVVCNRPEDDWAARGFVDLELQFGAGQPKLRIEAKLGTKLHDNQVERYREDGSDVVVLAPAAEQAALEAQLAQEGQPDVRAVTWQQTAGTIRLFAERCDEPVHRWLLEEFLKRLKEENLLPSERLTVNQIRALQHARAADDTLDELRRLAIHKVDTHSHSPYRRAGDARHWEQKLSRRSADQLFSGLDQTLWKPNCILEFKTIDSSEDGVLFAAGVSGVRGDAISDTTAGLARARALLEADPSWTDDLDQIPRLMRVADLSLLDDQPLDVQAAQLADWIVGSFDQLTDPAPA